MITRDMLDYYGSSYKVNDDGSFDVLGGLSPRSSKLTTLDGLRTVHRSLNTRKLPSLTSLGRTLAAVLGELSLTGSPLIRSLGDTLKHVGMLDIQGCLIYEIPSRLIITGDVVYLDLSSSGEIIGMSSKRARNILQDFKSGITTDEEAAIILLDRMNRPLWQVAYATDYLNKDIQV